MSYKSVQAIYGADVPGRAGPSPAQSCLWEGRISSDLEATNLTLSWLPCRLCPLALDLLLLQAYSMHTNCFSTQRPLLGLLTVDWSVWVGF